MKIIHATVCSLFSREKMLTSFRKKVTLVTNSPLKEKYKHIMACFCTISSIGHFLVDFLFRFPIGFTNESIYIPSLG